MTLMWGAVAASSLLVGAVLATLRRWHMGTIGLVLAFGAGLLLMLVRPAEPAGMLGWWGLGDHLAGFLDARVRAGDIAYFATLAGTGLLVTTARLLRLREGA